jgi:hypothetical protein
MACGFLHAAIAQGQAELADSMIFHASFDKGFDADVGVDRQVRTADTHNRGKIQVGNLRKDVTIVKDGGKYGDCLRFSGNAQEVFMYSGLNMGYQKQDWSGTVSFWLKLDPDKDLKPGFSDPLLITQNKWNDGAFFVDFDKELPRTLRLGTFSDFKFWNPKNRPLEKFKENERPMLPVKTPPFSSQRWTHVAFVFQGVNPSDGKSSKATLFLDGKPISSSSKTLRYTWDDSKAAIMLGVQFIGDFDDLIIFKRPLSPREIATLHQSAKGL